MSDCPTGPTNFDSTVDKDILQTFTKFDTFRMHFYETMTYFNDTYAVLQNIHQNKHGIQILDKFCEKSIAVTSSKCNLYVSNLGNVLCIDTYI